MTIVALLYWLLAATANSPLATCATYDHHLRPPTATSELPVAPG